MYKLLEFECHLDLQVESSEYIAEIEWRMKIQIQQDKPHMKWTSIARNLQYIHHNNIQCYNSLHR